MGGVKNPSPVEIQDEGVKVGVARTVDFTGLGVVASGGGGKVEVAISGGGGGMATHNLLTGYHEHPAGASGNVLTHLGSGAIPTYTAPAGGVGTHSFAGADHLADTWANILGKVSDAIPIKVGDSVASLGLWAGHIGSAAGHHAKYTDVEAKAAADTQVSIHAALVGIHHSPTHSLGGADHNPDTFANLLTKISNAVLLKSGDNVASLADYSAHVGSEGAHHTYPVPSGGVGSGAIPHGELRTIGATDHHTVNVDTHASAADAHYDHAGHVGSIGAHIPWPLPVGSVSGFAGHVGSTGAHHTYPIPSGGVASGAVPFLGLRSAVPVASGYTLQAIASGGVPTWAAGIVGPAGTMGPTGPAGATGPVGATYSQRAPMWYVAGTLSVGSQIAAQLFCDGNWTTHALRGFALTPPSGAAVTFDINAAGASVFASLPSILAGSQNIGAYSFATTGIASGARLSLDLDAVGSDYPGYDLSVQLTCKESLT